MHRLPAFPALKFPAEHEGGAGIMSRNAFSVRDDFPKQVDIYAFEFHAPKDSRGEGFSRPPGKIRSNFPAKGSIFSRIRGGGNFHWEFAGTLFPSAISSRLPILHRLQ
jgi:hypothetical protein